MSVAISLSFITTVAAQMTVSPAATQSPHWSHISVYDAGKGASGLADFTQATSQWFLAHVDAMEANGLSRLLRKANPGVTLSHHQVDLTQLAGPDAALLPEEYFFHVSEPTDLRFMNDDGTVQGDVSLPGCPNTRPVTRACRLQVFLNGSRRYVYNVSNEAFQAWKAAQLKRSGRALNLLILDNHAPGFVESMRWGKQTVVVAGGSLREFSEQQIGPPGGSWDQVYNDGVVAWLTSLADSFAQEGNAVLLNADRSLFHPMMLAQIKAARGLFTDVHHPEGLIGGSQYQALLDLIQTLVNTDGVVDLGGMWCHTGPSGYTAGLYTSPVARYRMWRLSSYYLLKQPFGSKGTVYFDPAFCSNTSGRPLYDPFEWLPAYEIDVGQPSGPAIVYQQGTAARSQTDGRPCRYHLFARPFTHGMVFVRSRDPGGCNDYTDATAVVVPLPTRGRLLMDNGTLSPPITTITLRNAEAAIVLTLSKGSYP